MFVGGKPTHIAYDQFNYINFNMVSFIAKLFKLWNIPSVKPYAAAECHKRQCQHPNLRINSPPAHDWHWSARNPCRP